MSHAQKKIEMLTVALFISLCFSFSNAFAGIPEPGLILYGQVRDVKGELVTSGDLTWTFTSGSTPLTVTVQLDEIQGPGGPYSYAVTIPCERAVPGFPVSDGVLSMETSPVTYTLNGEIDGTTMSMTDVLDLSDAYRGAAFRILIGDITLLDTDGDGIADSWERQIVDFYNDDDIETVADVYPEDDFDWDGFSNIREYLSASDPTFTDDIPNCWADLSGDGDVDAEELAFFSDDYFYNLCPACSFDLDDNGVMDSWDVIFFSEDFGRTDCW